MNMNMRLSKLLSFFKKAPCVDEQQHQAGTGFMQCPTDAIRELQAKGYTENLSACFDHLSCRSGEVQLYPQDFYIDEMLRFENSSDPDDNSILYAITCKNHKIKGLYIESYGTYHDELSAGMLDRIKLCRMQQQKLQQNLIEPRLLFLEAQP